ncbi:hypothetical protein E6W39_24420 [Kitasatospora acidiphila]|uniref:Terminase ATPase subunit N-terminal domain-containing protein n=1 Tax=Kitasatospora acidiphila TaxID=2567942 RepID=A0A540W705_9ACTN|nr:hypothetical protein [Kitasatospora acidiphila]TQF04796.1 hypothetical protein E6W39_24420 [Kitasatospora acidiphila]
MTALTAAERGELAERLLPVAAKLACVVRGDGDHHDVAHHTEHLDRTELIALIVVLAGLVDPDQRVTDALSYLTWDEHGRPAPATKSGPTTIRNLAGRVGGPMELGADMVSTSERIQRARHLYLHDGLTVTEVARAIGAGPKTVARWRDLGGWQQAPTIGEADSRPSRRRPAA